MSGHCSLRPTPTWTLDLEAVSKPRPTQVPETSERGLGPTGRRKHYFVSLPATASLSQLVRLAHHRWTIEQHYQDFKSELGLDHFEGRSYPGWQHHMVISAVAYGTNFGASSGRSGAWRTRSPRAGHCRRS
jgi:SRSO17 transposase